MRFTSLVLMSLTFAGTWSQAAGSMREAHGEPRRTPKEARWDIEEARAHLQSSNRLMLLQRLQTQAQLDLHDVQLIMNAASSGAEYTAVVHALAQVSRGAPNTSTAIAHIRAYYRNIKALQPQFEIAYVPSEPPAARARAISNPSIPLNAFTWKQWIYVAERDLDPTVRETAEMMVLLSSPLYRYTAKQGDDIMRALSRIDPFEDAGAQRLSDIEMGSFSSALAPAGREFTAQEKLKLQKIARKARLELYPQPKAVLGWREVLEVYPFAGEMPESKEFIFALDGLNFFDSESTSMFLYRIRNSPLPQNANEHSLLAHLSWAQSYNVSSKVRHEQ